MIRLLGRLTLQLSKNTRCFSNMRRLPSSACSAISERWPVSSACLTKNSAMDVTDDYIAQNLSARQREIMNLIVRGLSNKEIASILNLAEGLTAKECLQNAEVCLALAHKTKELDTRAALLGFAYEFRTVAKLLERDERKLMVRAASDGMQKHGV